MVLQYSRGNRSYLYPSSQDSQLLCQFWLLFVVLHGESGVNISCIRGIKSTYKTKLGSKGCQMQGMNEFQEAKKEGGRRVYEGGQPNRDSRCGVRASEINS